jgi:hypothetical protein
VGGIPGDASANHGGVGMSDSVTTDSHVERGLKQLKDFQKATVDVVYKRMFVEGQTRMLVADEVGLGKTIVAKGIIARRLKEKVAKGDSTPFRVTYICSNQIIAQENLRKLDLYPQQQSLDRNLDRLVFLALNRQFDQTSLLRLNSLTPGTSFRSSEHAGEQRERKIIYSLLMSDKGMLADVPDGLACLLRGSVQRPAQEWANHLEETRLSRFDPAIRADLPERFLTLIMSTPIRRPEVVLSHLPASTPTTLYEAVLEYACLLDFENFKRFRDGSLEIIRQLRKALAALCIDYIDADLYILDEFQRFRDLIDQESDSDAATIARQIFKKPGTKILLLSATPFKAFTGDSDLESGEEHYKEFRTVLSFLVENDPRMLAEYEAHRQALFKQLLNLWADTPSIDSTHRDAVESLLRQVMCRTERLSVSEDHDAMTEERWHDGPVTLTPCDVQNFVATDNVVQALNLTIDRKSHHLHAPVEFCKSAPFPLSFLDDYVLKKVLKAKKGERSVRVSLEANSLAWLDHERIDRYEMAVGADGSSFANARLTSLVEEVFDGQAEKLLWVPPCLPYYPLSGAFAKSDGFSKTLVFSAWLMVPRMLASLLSYEVERRTIGSAASVEPQERERGEPRTYFVPDGGRRHPVPQLVYRTEGGTEPTNMTNFALLFPSMTLAGIFQPANAIVLKVDQGTLEAQLLQTCRQLIESLNLRRFERPDGESDRWYWAAPLLLDKLNQEVEPHVGKWLRSDALRQTSFWTDHDSKDTGKSIHFQRLVRAFEAPGEIGLGPMPTNLADVLVDIALGSSAVAAFRSLRRNYRLESAPACILSLSVANEFVNLFNKPEAIAAVRIAVEGRMPYWQKTLRYCREGCLQAVLDEYLHLLKAECETASSAVERLNDSINLKTTSIKVDDLGTFMRDERKNMRCHFAVDLGNQRIETEEGSQRVTSIRQNFNSPFRPFIVATTSIGQEGLDFHQYCRKVVHWNLPSNPIDLEQREGRVNRFKGLVIRQQIAHKYSALMSAIDLKDEYDLWDYLFCIAEVMERDGTSKCELVPYWHVETKGSERYRIERIIPFYPFSRDRAKLSSILRTLAIYRLAFGQPRQSELIDHLLKHIPPDKIPSVRKSLLIDLSPISYRSPSAERLTEGPV